MDYIAAVQINSFEGDLNRNTDRIIEFIREIKKSNNNIKTAVFPELCLYGYERLDEIPLLFAQCDIDKCLKKISKVCIEYEIEAVIGAPFIHSERVENALYFISNKGRIIHVYSKTHLISCEQESLSAGNYFGICSTSFGEAGFLVCWDLAFPEAARLYAKANTKLLIAGAAWEAPFTHQWKTAVCSRSFDNCLPIIAANRAEENRNTVFCGHSLITDCMGNILAEADDKSEMFISAPCSEIFHIDKDFGLPLAELREDIYNTNNIKKH